MKNKVGIVGQGFVGSAIKEGLKNYHIVTTYDIDKNKSDNSDLRGLVKKSRVIFVCLPTPMKKSGECDISIVYSTVWKINRICEELNTNKTVIIKSTIPPGTTEKINAQCPIVDVIFSPEFLTEANSFEDFKNQNRIILGGSTRGTANAKLVLEKAFPNIPIIQTDSKTAEMVKYFTNCFLATKVIFANQMKEICDSMEVNYGRVVKSAVLDSRIGASHLKVPGPDGDFGFGGHCFPKDLRALIYSARESGADTSILDSVWEKNDKIRINKDWEKMVGRAVSEE